MYYCNTLKITFQNTKVNVKSVLKSVDEWSLSALTVVASPRGRVSSLSQVFSAGWEFREEGGASPPARRGRSLCSARPGVSKSGSHRSGEVLVMNIFRLKGLCRERHKEGLHCIPHQTPSASHSFPLPDQAVWVDFINAKQSKLRKKKNEGNNALAKNEIFNDKSHCKKSLSFTGLTN